MSPTCASPRPSAPQAGSDESKDAPSPKRSTTLRSSARRPTRRSGAWRRSWASNGPATCSHLASSWVWPTGHRHQHSHVLHAQGALSAVGLPMSDAISSMPSPDSSPFVGSAIGLWLVTKFARRHVGIYQEAASWSPRPPGSGLLLPIQPLPGRRRQHHGSSHLRPYPVLLIVSLFVFPPSSPGQSPGSSSLRSTPPRFHLVRPWLAANF